MNLIKLSVGLLIATIAVNAQANPEKDCGLYDTVAKGAMESRQQGVPLADALNHFNEILGKDDARSAVIALDALKFAYIEAYKTPKYRTESMQQEAINEFRSKLYGDCLSVMSKNRNTK